MQNSYRAMYPRKLLVLGGTGATGTLIVERALERGWSVTVYGRRTLPEHASNEGVTTIQGSLDDAASLRRAIAGQDVVISVVGPSSPLASTEVFVPAYRTILSTMRDEGVHRIIALSTFSVHDPNDRPNFLRWVLVAILWAMANKVWRTVVNIAEVFDSEGSDIDWTLFRVGFLANGPRSRVVEGYVGDGMLGMYLRRADIAEWVLTEAERSEPRYIHQKPGICSK
ncbi:Flavin reductase (NADPH) [Paramyrothecium foliicola]|nr:Flavin reductase (NADPH) [Paramyrothecium foliicola]